MKNIVYFIFLILIVNSSLSDEIKIYYPDSRQELCRTTPLVVKWTGPAVEVNVEIKKENESEYKSVINYQISDNTFLWTVNDAEYLNVPLSVRVSDKNNPENYDEFHGITVFSETEILQQTQSVQVCSSEDIYLQVDALGFNLTYQWFKDGIMLNGERSSLLSITKIRYNQSGVYSCLIMTEGSCNDTVSNPIPVYVATKTEFVHKPNDVQYSVYEALKEEKTTGRMTAKIHVNNIEELKNIKFQWLKDSLCLEPLENGGGYLGWWRCTIRIKLEDDARITGSTSQTLQIRDMVWGDRANYYCIATGLCGSDTTRCYVGENTHFLIKNNFIKFEGCQGEDVTLKVTVKKFFNGRLLYQWCKAGNIKIEESEKFIGTQTPELTIKNTDAVMDNNVYYCRVTLIEYNITQHSNEFFVEPFKVPKIALQPHRTVIKDKRNKFYGQTYIDVIVENPIKCLYTWYRNGKQARKTCWLSDYWLGRDSCPPPDNAPPPRPAVPEDVGWYKCKIENKCGIIWSDSVYVSWGFNDVAACVGKDAIISVDKLEDNYYYEWTKNNNVINESSKYFDTDSHELKIKNLNNNDEGFYHCFAVNKSNNSKFEYGQVFLEVRQPPVILKEFPDEIVNDGLSMRYVAVTASSKGERFYYRLYIDDEPAEPLKEIINNNHLESTYPFYLGGYNTNLKSGRYKYYFKNDCGEVWSKEMKIINTAYKPGGKPIPEDELITAVVFDSDIQSSLIYPNPASDFIEINISNKGLKPFAEIENVQIFDMLGIEVLSIGTGLDLSTQRINISHLPAGVYYIRIGDKVEKFLKM